MRFFSVFLLFLFIFFVSPFAFGVQKGSVEYSIPIEYSVFNETELNKEAENLFKAFENSVDERQRKLLLEKMLWEYTILGELDKENPLYFTRLGIIFDKLKKDRYAKSNFFRSQNLVPDYPYSAYSFGNFYFDRKEYRKALKEYQKAYNSGYSNHYQTLYQLGTIYEKLGDLSSALIYFKRAYNISVSTELNNKILKLEELNQNNYIYNQNRGINR